jgi:hypothetical protein
MHPSHDAPSRLRQPGTFGSPPSLRFTSGTEPDRRARSRSTSHRFRLRLDTAQCRVTMPVARRENIRTTY